MELKIEKINKSFGSNHVLRDISFSAKNGVATGLLGRNGSGKTTTIRIIMDIYASDSGTVTIDGKPIKEFVSKIGYLPEERGLYPKRLISDQMTYLGELRGMKARDARKRGKMLLEKFEAGQYFDVKLETLSKGNQQKIQMAIALINNPEIIILDEPFSGLDPVNSQILKRTVEELINDDKIVLFSSHQMSYVEQFCDNICIIDKGKIVLEGDLRNIKKTYPRDRVQLISAVDQKHILHNLMLEKHEIKTIIHDFTETKSGFLIRLNNANDKASLFTQIADSGINIDVFRVVEPTLEEIFVEKAGGINETV